MMTQYVSNRCKESYKPKKNWGLGAPLKQRNVQFSNSKVHGSLGHLLDQGS